MMPFDPDKFLKDTAPGSQFDPDAYLRANPDPNRGVLDKAGDFYEGVSKGMIGTALGITRHLPGDELPFLPESARQARRAARGEVQKSVDVPDPSNYGTTGRIVGREAPFFMVPGGGRVAAWGAEGLTRASPTLAQLVAFLHSPLETLLGRGVLHQTGVLPKLQQIANIMAPGVGAGVGTITKALERIGAAESLNAFGGRDDPNAAQTPPAATPLPAAVPRAPVPGPTTPRAPAPTDPGRDADTDAPVANRSSKGDRFQPSSAN